MILKLLYYIADTFLRWALIWEKKEAERLLGATRSPHWSSVRNKWLKENPTCAVTGDTRDCEVHHIIPFHKSPALELDENNFITLRRDMHYLFGHFMNWSSFNKDVRVDVLEWAEKIKTRP